VLDEVHTYTGALGSEVACLVRRLRRVARKGPQDIVCFGTSATVQEGDQQGSTGIDTRIDARKLGVSPWVWSRRPREVGARRAAEPTGRIRRTGPPRESRWPAVIDSVRDEDYLGTRIACIGGGGDPRRPNHKCAS